MLNAIYSKTKETLRTADKLVLMIVICIVLGAFLIVPAAASSGSGGKTTTSLAGLDMNIGSFSGLITDAFSEMMGSVSGDADDRIAFMKTFDHYVNTADYQGNPVDDDIGLYNIGNVLGVQSTKTSKSHASNIYSISDDQTAMRLTLDTIRGWYRDETATTFSDNLSASLMSQYILFGSGLTEMGIDEFRDAVGNMDMVRMITGYALYVFFILAYSASGIMVQVTELLQYLNIFGILHNSMLSNTSSGTVAVNTSNNGISMDSALLESLKHVYRLLMPFRWIILGLLVILFVASVTIYKSKAMGVQATNQERVRRLIMRVIIMCIGVPLVGMVYTTCLNATYSGLSKSTYNIADYVFAQLLDYEQWTASSPYDAFRGIAFYDSTAKQRYKPMIVEFDTNTKTVDVFFRKSNGEKEAIDVPYVVYEANRNMYGGEVIYSSNSYPNLSKAIYSSNSVSNGGNATQNGVYGTLINGQNTYQTNIDKELQYKSVCDLILKYARNNTVVADNLNEYYTEGLGRIGQELEISGDDEKTAYSAILTRLFSPDASSNMWAFSPHINGTNEKVFDKWGDKFVITVRGMPVFSYAGINPGATDGFTNTYKRGITIEKKGSGKSLYAIDAMWQVLWFVKRSDTGVQAKGRSGSVAFDGQLRTIPSENSVTYIEPVANSSTATKLPTYKYSYAYVGHGMSPLALYNFLHSKFEAGVLDVYTPALTSNSGVSTMHYAVTTPYSGVAEIVQLLFTICILFSIGILGWVFGISLLFNTIVQVLKSIPLIFKMAIGSLQGFVEAILTVLAIIAEMLITMALYAFSIQIIDFLIKVMDAVAMAILSTFMSTNTDTYAFFSNILSMGVILWGTFEIIRWRQVVTMSVKSMITHVVNTVFGTSAAMPSSASSGMLKAAAVGMTAAAVGGALAEQGTLDDVVNDMTQSDIGSSVGDKLKEGDFGGALQDVKDYAKGEYDGDVRGGSAMDREAQSKGLLPKYDENGNRAHDEDTGEALYEDPTTGESYTESEIQDLPDNNQSLTDEQQKAVDDMDSKISGLRSAGKNEEADDMAMKRAAMVAGFKKDNYDKAKEAGVSDWAPYEKSLADTNTGATENAPETVEPADIPAEPSHELSGDAQDAYTAAQKGDAPALREAGKKFNAHGLTAKQQAAINAMVASGASEEEVAAAIDNFAQQNFGDNYGAVVDKMNEACGRDGSFTYGSNDNSEGNARTVSVDAGADASGNRQYTAQDYASSRGAQVIGVSESNGVSSYTNWSQGGGAENTVQTVDMGAAGNVGAQDYAGTYNSVAGMVRASGVEVGPQAMGAGGVQQVTVSEMAAQSATLQAAEMGYTVNQQGYGNTSASNVGMAMSTAQVRATTLTAAGGGDASAVQVQYTPITVSDAAGAAAGVATYDTSSSMVGGQPQVQLIRTGGAEGSPNTVTVQYNGQGQSNYVGLSDVNGDTANLNVPMANGTLEMIKDAGRAKLIIDAMNKLNGDSGGDTTGDTGGGAGGRSRQ